MSLSRLVSPNGLLIAKFTNSRYAFARPNESFIRQVGNETRLAMLRDQSDLHNRVSWCHRKEIRMLRALGVIVICGTAVMASSQSDPPKNTWPTSALPSPTSACLSRLAVGRCLYETRKSKSAIGVSQQQTSTKSTAIVGLDGVKEKTKGTLKIEDKKLCFIHSGTTSQISAPAMEDVVTGEDSQRVIRGTLGTLSMFAPYESGRALSMLRSKLDSLTIQFRDNDGGLHGAVFTMPVGTAEPFKQELIAQGAHTTIHAAKNANVGPSNQVAAREKQ
jgi:hypothetical protein